MAGIKIIDVKEVDDKMIDKMLNKNSEEFNLSEKRLRFQKVHYIYPEKDVKEFVEIVEEIVKRRCMGTNANCYEINKEIKERAGDKLK